MAKSNKPQPTRSSNAPKPAAPVEKGSGMPSAMALAMERMAPVSEGDNQLKKIFHIAALAILAIMLFMSLGSGINADDKFQCDYSTKLVNYYGTFGKDTSALYIKDGNMHLYGGFFEIVTGFVNKGLGLTDTDLGYHQVRNLSSALLGWVAILCTALLVSLIAGWRAALLTLIIMALSPRFIGDSMMNPKDIPFAAGYMMALYNLAAVLTQMPNPKRWNIVGLVCGLAMALAIRAGGLLPFIYVLMFGGLQLLLKYGVGGIFGNFKNTARYIIVLGGSLLAAYALAVLFWPYALQNPLKNPFVALSKFSELEVKIRVLYEGSNVMSDKTPWHYPIKWIAYTIPLAALIGFLGCIALAFRMFKQYNPLLVALVLFAGIFPVFYIIYKHSVIHDGWRHLTFAYPPIAAAAGLFWNELANIFSGKKALQTAVFVVFGLLLADSAWYIAANRTLSYTYFNPIPGGTKGAFGKFETDYWGVSTRQGLEWLESQGLIGANTEKQVVIATNMFYSARVLSSKYGDKVKILYLKYDRRCDAAWDYALYPTRFIDGTTLQQGKWPTDNTIHTIDAGGAPMLAILKNSENNCFQGMEATKKGDWAAAVDAFKKEVTQVPDNELAWANLGNAQLNTGQLEEAKQSAEKTLEIAPDDSQGNNLIGLYYLRKGDNGAAKNQFEAAIKRNPSNATAYYYLALISQNSGDAQTALNYLQKCINIAPNFKAAFELAANIYESMGNSATAQKFRQMSK